MKRVIFSALVTMSAMSAMSISAHAGVIDYEAIHAASIHGDIQKMEVLCHDLAVPNGDAYLAAYCDYRLAYAGMGQLDNPAVREKVSAALARSRDQLQHASDTEGEKKAENLALLAIVYGAQIHIDPAMGSKLGRNAWTAAKEAESLAPANPRVQLAKAGNLLFTPPAYGGDINAAAKALEIAKRAYPARPSADNWGLDDTYMYSSIVHTKSKQYELAKADLDQVLAISPAHGWALYQLKQLP